MNMAIDALKHCKGGDERHSSKPTLMTFNGSIPAEPTVDAHPYPTDLVIASWAAFLHVSKVQSSELIAPAGHTTRPSRVSGYTLALPSYYGAPFAAAQDFR